MGGGGCFVTRGRAAHARAAGGVWGVWEYWGEVLGGAWSEGVGKGVLGEDCGGCTMRCRGGRTRVPASSGRWSWLLAAGVPTPLAPLPGTECMAAGHRRRSAFFFARPVLMPPPLLPPLPAPSACVCRVGMLLFSFLTTLVCCVLVTAFPATDRPPLPIPLCRLTATGTSL